MSFLTNTIRHNSIMTTVGQRLASHVNTLSHLVLIEHNWINKKTTANKQTKELISLKDFFFFFFCHIAHYIIFFRKFSVCHSDDMFSCYYRACIAIAILFILSASGIFIRTIRSLVVEKHATKVSNSLSLTCNISLKRRKKHLYITSQ